MGIEQFRYDGKRAVIVGGATGMGAAAAALLAELGAELVVLDVQDVAYDVSKSVRVDLRSQASIDAALDEVGGPIDALFSCAGIADGGIDLMQVNFIGHRHFIETAVARGYLPEGSAIAGIASTSTPATSAAAPWARSRPRSSTCSRRRSVDRPRG